jgi:putative transposase
MKKRSDTYTKIYIHVIFAVKRREALISSRWDERLYKYITGIVKEKQQFMLAINGVSDHIHFLISMRPTCCLSDLVREVKKSSNSLINNEALTPFHFEWQEGFGAFSCGERDVDKVKGYIFRQKEHHRAVSFRDEYLAFLKENEIDFKEDYVFDWILQ